MAKKETTYQSAVAEIEEILAEIENEDPDVDELAAKVKRVATLLKICKDKLHSTEIEVEKVLKDMEK